MNINRTRKIRPVRRGAPALLRGLGRRSGRQAARPWSRWPPWFPKARCGTRPSARWAPSGRTRSAGAVELRIYAGGVAGDEPDVVRKMRIGQIHAAALSVTGLIAIDNSFEIFQIPFFFESWDELCTTCSTSCAPSSRSGSRPRLRVPAVGPRRLGAHLLPPAGDVRCPTSRSRRSSPGPATT